MELSLLQTNCLMGIESFPVVVDCVTHFVGLLYQFNSQHWLLGENGVFRDYFSVVDKYRFCHKWEFSAAGQWDSLCGTEE